MKQCRLLDAAAYQAWVFSQMGEGKSLFALIDPARYEDVESCRQELGLDPGAFAALPNVYEKYALSIRAQGPRLFSADSDSPLWTGIFAQAYVRQAASFLIASHPASLLEHLRSLTRLRQPDGSNLLFRFQDVIVLSALAPVLDQSQQAAFAGPASAWLVTDVCGGPHRIRPESRGQWPKFELTEAQLARLDDALAAFTIIYQANETDETLLKSLDPCMQVRLIRARIHRARRHGLQRKDDIALYCVLSLQLPLGFDRRGPVADALTTARRDGTTFGEEIDRVPVSRWREWDQELDMELVHRTA